MMEKFWHLPEADDEGNDRGDEPKADDDDDRKQGDDAGNGKDAGKEGVVEF